MSNSWKDAAVRAGNKAGGIVSSAMTKAGELGQHLKPEVQDVQQATDWVKKAASTTATEASRLGKEAMKSDMAKDAAAFAAIGAAVAVPVPVVGPVFGAVVGAAIGVYKNLGKTVSAKLAPTSPPPAQQVPAKDLYAELTKLDDLRQCGILTTDEFEMQKKKLLGGE